MLIWEQKRLKSREGNKVLQRPWKILMGALLAGLLLAGCATGNKRSLLEYDYPLLASPYVEQPYPYYVLPPYLLVPRVPQDKKDTGVVQPLPPFLIFPGPLFYPSPF